jgi:lipopolysaccharide cholinephosphotransferase
MCILFLCFCQNQRLFPLKKLKFEDITIPVQNEYMTLLERYYGSDVMQLPPEEKRVNHAPAVIEFGPYTNELLDREELI